MSTLWQSYSFSVLLAEAGTTDGDFLTYADDLSRVRIDQAIAATAPSLPAGATRVVERSADEIHWTTVRGGDEADVDAAAVTLDDFEFAENSQNTYRIRVLVDGDLFWTFRDQITVALDVPWLKSISFPFLNRPVDNSTAEPRVRPSRSGVFPVVGRSLAVAVTDVRGGPQYNLTIATATDVDRVAVEAMFAPGDVMLLQVPPTAAPGPGAAYPIPGGYYAVGDITEDPRDMPWDRRWWLLPLTKVAPPAPSITGATITWRGLGNRYATLADMKAANATWRDVLELQGTPQDVVIP